MDNDILRELEVKNKEIFFNKLNIDVDNNNEVLLISLENLINLFRMETINKILDIESSTMNKDSITTAVNNFYEILFVKLKELMEIRYKSIKENIPTINDNYGEILNNAKDILLENIKKCFMDNVDSLIKNVSIKYSEGEIIRLSDYLKVLNYEKIITKINELFINTNTILLNNYNENLEKYNQLNAKTLK